ncbi:NFACT RNA binding domain-containing protein [Reichenbachiella versicolor]|uniref:NFACT RNA binding domain-containing protein n=1 Tax=Reichenbachiella versicolor TaxID=1821036 RepID=UPI000D6E5A24|nr:NFACT RNA binding domain-containing protein [Reichenbachiella versicolor]
MQFNYYFLKHLTPILSQEIKGGKIARCFSQNKNELIIEILRPTKELFTIKLILDGQVSILSFPETYARARKNSVDIFPEILEYEITSLTQFSNERSFALNLKNDFSILFKLHGRLANVILFNKKSPFSLFKNSLTNDSNIELDNLNKNVIQNFEEFKSVDGNLKLAFPTFDNNIIQYLKNRGYENESLEEKWKLVEHTLVELNTPKFYLTKNTPKLLLLTPKEEHSNFSNPIDASNQYANKFLSTFYLARDKNAILNKVRSDIKKAKGYIKKSQSKLLEIKERRSYEEIANILMANLHIKQEIGSKTIDLLDFYNNKDIRIKLNGKLSLQANAESYYRKAKNQKIEIDQLVQNISNKEQKLFDLLKQEEEVNSISNHKELRPFLISSNKPQKEIINLPYTSQIIEGYEVRIGKNAKANDELTLKMSQKNDLWLHARDVAGSHVVIKSKNLDSYPNSVIEKAAQLAAWHSKRKHDTLCPVIYTLKKYVTKAKGAPAGAVRVHQEKVVMVEPKREL